MEPPSLPSLIAMRLYIHSNRLVKFRKQRFLKRRNRAVNCNNVVSRYSRGGRRIEMLAIQRAKTQMMRPSLRM